MEHRPFRPYKKTKRASPGILCLVRAPEFTVVEYAPFYRKISARASRSEFA